jgi:flagellar transcriptional activator FlhD
MNDDQLTQEIQEANLTYLMLAQNVIRRDKAEALFRLGISEESADLIAMLSPQQMLKIAASPMLLCRFRVDDEVVWGLLTNHSTSKVANDATARLHASILMADRFEQAL